MKTLKHLTRLIRINHILAKNGFDEVLASIPIFSAFHYLGYINPWNWFRKKTLTRGQALRQILEELGPIFVKFGQAMSTRPDIFPEDVVSELKQLQDNVAPFSSDIAVELIEKALGKPVYEVFLEFDPTPMASASIAQVHAAKLHSGEDVVVKIVRPNMRKVIDQDLGLLKLMAAFIEKYWSFGKRLKPKQLVSEFEKNLINELDLAREAANAAQLRRNFKQSPLLYIPEVHWDYVRDNVLVMERIYGIHVGDLPRLKEMHYDLKKLAERSFEIFFIQVFQDCFFHADMHPGNIFVSPKNPRNPQYMCVDFGIVGTLTDTDKRYLAENLFAFFNRDYKRIAVLHVESGWVDNHTSIEEFESAIRTVCEPIFEKSLKDISFALVILKLFQVARRFEMQIQPQLVLLQKTLFAIEGLGRQIYPELNLWDTGKPFLERWLREQVSPKVLIKNIKENVAFFIDKMPYMPRLMNDVLTNIKANQEERIWVSKQDHKTSRLWWRGLITGMVVTTLIFVGLVYVSHEVYNPWL